MADLNESYRTLGVLPGASFDEAKAAWRLRAQAFHPDHFHDAPAEERAAAERQFKELSEAWRVVRDHLGPGSPEPTTDSWRSASSGRTQAWSAMPSTRRVWSPSPRSIAVVVVVAALLVVGLIGYRMAARDGGTNQREWSADTQAQWNVECQRQSGSILRCRCVLDAIMSEVAETDLPEFNQSVLATGSLPPRVEAATAACINPP